ncbi:hypothetical protein ZWY2020_025362 [Hordeum vulgare]|nr:hypothetical protein ZWY2020_025362 [Hordeum vulgare]
MSSCGALLGEMDKEKPQENEECQGSKKKRKRNRNRKNKMASNCSMVEQDDPELPQDNAINSYHPKHGCELKRLKMAGSISRIKYCANEDTQEKCEGSKKKRNRNRNKKNKTASNCSMVNQDDPQLPQDNAINSQRPKHLDQPVEDDVDGEYELADFIKDNQTTGPVASTKNKWKPNQPRKQFFIDWFGSKKDQDEYAQEIRQRRRNADDELIMDMPEDDVDQTEVISKVERMNQHQELSEMQIDEESTWIQRQISCSGLLSFSGQEEDEYVIDKECIMKVLHMLYNKKLEIPEIAMHNDRCPNYFIVQDANGHVEKYSILKLLWSVEALSTRWLQLQKHKQDLKGYWKRKCDGNNAIQTFGQKQSVYRSIDEALEVADSEEYLEDVRVKINSHFPRPEAEQEEKGSCKKIRIKQPKMKSKFSSGDQKFLREIATKFGSAEELGRRLVLHVEDILAEDEGISPMDFAARFRSEVFCTKEALLLAAKDMATYDIGHEPIIKNYIRSNFMDQYVISTTAIEPLIFEHANKFVGAQWLHIQEAESKKLLQVIIQLPEDTKKSLMSKVRDHYTKGSSKETSLWNEERTRILDDMFSKFLFPSMEKEIRNRLTAKSKNWLRVEYGKQLWSKVSVAPWKKADIIDEMGLRVMACCIDPANKRITFVMLDTSGNLVDVLCTCSIRAKSKDQSKYSKPLQEKEEREKRQPDLFVQKEVVQFVANHLPNVICIGASKEYCRGLKYDLHQFILNVVKTDARNVNPQAEISVIYGDESLPRFYVESKVSSVQLPGRSDTVKRAVALGRYLQNPLAMVAALCGPQKDIVEWKLHPFQDHLDVEERYEIAVQVMTYAENQIKGRTSFPEPDGDELKIQLGEIDCDTVFYGSTYDPYSCKQDMPLKSKQDKVKKEHFKKRMVSHPKFQNLRPHELKEFFSKEEVGHFLFRPTPGDTSSLILSVKVFNGIHADTVITESNKEFGTATVSLGKSLHIGDASFQDLDEVCVRYVDPVVERLKEMLCCKNFREGPETEMRNLRLVEKIQHYLGLPMGYKVEGDDFGSVDDLDDGSPLTKFTSLLHMNSTQDGSLVAVTGRSAAGSSQNSRNQYAGGSGGGGGGGQRKANRRRRRLHPTLAAALSQASSPGQPPVPVEGPRCLRPDPSVVIGLPIDQYGTNLTDGPWISGVLQPQHLGLGSPPHHAHDLPSPV